MVTLTSRERKIKYYKKMMMATLTSQFISVRAWNFLMLIDVGYIILKNACSSYNRNK